ncbi:phage tail spike protein [Adlercreutzia sp.]|uniref:phage tail spike protein n=1 Tax=Adlercreutzia sp. TaxID=1872387 RepID=UPI003AB447C1
MLYTVTIANGSEVVRVHDRYERVADARIAKERNAIDSLTFTIYPDNPGYDLLNNMKTTVQVRNGKTGALDFDGRVVKAPGSMSTSGLISKAVQCESVEAYLCDSTQPYLSERQWSGGNGKSGLQEFIDYVLARHNERVEPHKRIYRGRVDLVTYETTGGVYKGLQRESTRDTLFGKLVDVFGGEMRVRRNEADGLLYLDYSEKLGTNRDTPIEVARNMASVTMDEDPTQIITRLYPLGAKKENSEDRITVASVNSGREYIDDAEAMAKYGIIEGTNTWDDVTVPANLLSASRAWLTKNNQFPHSASVSAYDLSLIDMEPDEFKLLDWYQCRNHLVGLDEPLEVIKQTIDINEPHKSSIELGDSTTRQSSQATAAIASKVATLEKLLGL